MKSLAICGIGGAQRECPRSSHQAGIHGGGYILSRGRLVFSLGVVLAPLSMSAAIFGVRKVGLVSAIARRLRGRAAIKRANQSFEHINRFIAEINEILYKELPPGLVSSAGVSLTAWSREGDHIVSSSQAQESNEAAEDYSTSDNGRQGSGQNW